MKEHEMMMSIGILDLETQHNEQVDWVESYLRNPCDRYPYPVLGFKPMIPGYLYKHHVSVSDWYNTYINTRYCTDTYRVKV